MNYEQITRFADAVGVSAFLDRIGLRSPLSEIARLTLDRAQRERWETIWEDYRTTREQFERLTRDAPAGDPDKRAWLISSMQTPWGLKLEGVISLAARMAGYMPVAIHPQRDGWIERYHSLFRIENHLNLAAFRQARNGKVSGEISDFVHSRPGVSDLLDFRFHNVDIGRIALSNVLNRRKFSRFDIGDPATLLEVGKELEHVRMSVLAAEKMLDVSPPSIGFLLEKGLSPMAEVFGVCIARGIPVIQYVGSQNANDYVLKRFTLENRHQHPFSLDNSTWKQVQRMPWSRGHETELMREFEESYVEGRWFNRKFLHQDKLIKSPDQVRRQLALDPAKKTAVIFSHVLWDATFFYGEGLFENYEQWLLQTVTAACRNPRVNWVIKLHPDLVWKLKYEGYTGELRDILAIRSSVGELPEYVKLVTPDTDISSYSFFQITDYCLTVRGTIGIEMACHGVPVITAGTGRYSGLGFTIESATSLEYLDRLADIQNILPPSAKQTELARRFAYALFKQRPWPMRSFEMVKKPIQETGHPLDHNLIPHVRTFSDLRAAEDMREIVCWIKSGAVDYFHAPAHL
jgi:hypothetical protein